MAYHHVWPDQRAIRVVNVREARDQDPSGHLLDRWGEELPVGAGADLGLRHQRHGERRMRHLCITSHIAASMRPSCWKH
jgi:hypothetical protein